MGLTIAISNRKGGCGKTTICISLAQELIRRGYKVLVVDCDSQKNTTDFYGAEWEDESTVVDMLLGDVPAKECVQHCQNGDIIAADSQLSGADNLVKRDADEYYHIKESLESVRNDYDFILFDTAAAVDVTLNNVLTATDYLIIPIDGQYAIDGITDYSEHIAKFEKRINPDLTILGFVFNRFRKNVRITNEVVNASKDTADVLNTQLFETKIRATADCERAISDERVPLYRLNKKSNTQVDMEMFTSEVLKSIKATAKGKDIKIKRNK